MRLPVATFVLPSDMDEPTPAEAKQLIERLRQPKPTASIERRQQWDAAMEQLRNIGAKA